MEDKANPIVLRCAKDHLLIVWSGKRNDPETWACPICHTVYLRPAQEEIR